MKVVRLSALHTGRLYPPPPRKYSWYSFLLEAESTHLSVAGRIKSMKNFIGTIGNRTRDLAVCSAVPKPTAPPRASYYNLSEVNTGWTRSRYSTGHFRFFSPLPLRTPKLLSFQKPEFFLCGIYIYIAVA